MPARDSTAQERDQLPELGNLPLSFQFWLDLAGPFASWQAAGHGTEIPGHDASSSSTCNLLDGALNRLRHLSAQGGGGAPFACMTRALGLRGGHAAKSMKEAKTGVEFPETYCHLSRKDCPSLMGVGARAKKLVGIKNIDVYAMGFYMDENAAKQTCDKDFSCLPPASLEQNQALAERVKAMHDIEKSVRIVVTSGLVNQERFSKGLRESLEPRLRAENDMDSLGDFEALFKGAKFHKGLEMVFTNTQAGALALKIGDNEVGIVESPIFTRAFFDLYIGADPVSKDGKASIAKGIANTVSRAGF